MDIDRILAITLSGVRPGDKDSVKDLLAACGLHTQDLSDEILQHFVVARKGERIIGTAGLEIVGSDALFRSLSVAEDFRKQGVAQKLLTAAQRYAFSQNVDTLYLLTLTAESFFSGKGFQRIDRKTAPQGIRNTVEFSVLCPDTAVCMRKRPSAPC
jgi:amino-acid N-acetyltransferase